MVLVRKVLNANKFTASPLYLFVKAIGLSDSYIHENRASQCRYFIYLAPINFLTRYSCLLFKS